MIKMNRLFHFMLNNHSEQAHVIIHKFNYNRKLR